MKIIDTPLKDLKVIELDVYGDNRGFFVERFNLDKFKKLGLPTEFVQDNHSRSAPGVLRGLHYQYEPAQGKLVGCVNGRLLDVAVDIRKDSPTLGKWFSIELSSENGKLLWVPAGFAHGFCVLGDKPADMYYKITGGTYNPKGEGGIMWNDPEIVVDWGLDNPQISERDMKQESFKEYLRDAKF